MRICRYYAIEDPSKAGAMTLEALCELGRQYRHLIPCGARNWAWVYRETCRRCVNGQYFPQKTVKK